MFANSDGRTEQSTRVSPGVVAPSTDQPSLTSLPGSVVQQHLPSRERVIEAFRQAVLVERTASSSRLVRFRQTVSFQIVGTPSSETVQLVTDHAVRLLAQTGLTAVPNGTGEHGQVFFLFVDRLNLEALEGHPGLLGAFWGGAARNLATARSAFQMEAGLPLAAQTRAMVRWLVDRDGYILKAAVVVEAGQHDMNVTRRIRREISRVMGIQGYGFEIGHSLFDLRSLALDLTAIDIRVLRTLYHPALQPGLGRDAALEAVSRLL